MKRNYQFQRENRNLIAIDETVVKARKKKYYVYSAVDVERNEIVLNESLYNKELFDYEVFRQRST